MTENKPEDVESESNTLEEENTLGLGEQPKYEEPEDIVREVKKEIPDWILSVEQIADILGAVKNEFIELYTTDIRGWKRQCDVLFRSNYIHLQDTLKKYEQVKTGENTKNYDANILAMANYIKEMKTLVSDGDIEEIGKLVKKSRDIGDIASVMSVNSPNYGKKMEELSCLYAAYHSVLYIYCAHLEERNEKSITALMEIERAFLKVKGELEE